MRNLSFDRGTLLFEGEWDADLLGRLPGVRFDPRCGRDRAPPFRHPAIVDELRLSGVPFDDRVGADAGARLGEWQKPDLRPYQQAAVCAWTARDRRGIVALPTGSGKTRVAMAAAAHTRRSTLVLVPTRVLMHQWREQLVPYYQGHVGLWGDGEHELAPVTIMTFESAYRNMARIGDRFGLLIIDEVHHFGAGARDEAIEMSTAAERLGLTATVPRDAGVVERLGDLVGPVVFGMSISDLAGSYLADFDLVEIPVRLDDDERLRYERDIAAFREFHRVFGRGFGSDWRGFVAVAQQTAEGRAALASWRRARKLVAFTRGKARIVSDLLRANRNRRVLVFTADNDTAYAIARRELVMPLTCDIKRAERDEALARFRRGELRALVSARVLNEGIDVPDADVAIIVGGSHGEREHVQRVGRLLRPAEGKRAAVYEIVAAGTREARAARDKRRSLGPARVA